MTLVKQNKYKRITNRKMEHPVQKLPLRVSFWTGLPQTTHNVIAANHKKMARLRYLSGWLHTKIAHPSVEDHPTK